MERREGVREEVGRKGGRKEIYSLFAKKLNLWTLTIELRLPNRVEEREDKVNCNDM